MNAKPISNTNDCTCRLCVADNEQYVWSGTNVICTSSPVEAALQLGDWKRNTRDPKNDLVAWAHKTVSRDPVTIRIVTNI